MDTVHLILQTVPETTIALNEDKPTAPNAALCMMCDYNKMIFFDSLKQGGALAWVQDEMRCFRHNFQVKFCLDTESSEPAKFLSHTKSGPYNKLDILLKPQINTSPPKKIITLQMRRRTMSSVGSKRKRSNILDVADE
jgi:hypothetical protein